MLKVSVKGGSDFEQPMQLVVQRLDLNLCIPEETYGCIPSPLVEKREVPFDNLSAVCSRKWLVVADEGGAPGLGTRTPRAGSGESIAPKAYGRAGPAAATPTA